ncbi:MAG: GFA family protein [Betaproteobacteria bacterium]|nr:GFA family protein [Betaproteobacteria bacterium]
MPWVTFERKSFRFTKGKPRTFRSSKPVGRTFCPACGTQLSYQSRKWPTTIDITTCSLDAPAKFPPTHHSWVSHDIGWVKTSGTLPAFPKFRPS